VRQADIAGWGGVWNVEFSSHNNWVDIIAQTGILGLSIVLAFAFSMGRVGLRLFRVSPDGFPRAYAAASVAGLVATLVSGMLGDWFLPFIYNIGLNGMRSSILFWVFMGGLLSLYMNPGLVGRKTEPG
jgi:O-antigen ligase